VQGAALELLAQVAGAVWSTFTVPTPSDAIAGDDLQEAVPELVTIAPAPQTAPPAEDAGQVGTLPHRTWESLPVEEQQIHLRAQRFARVQVAEMRLYEADTVQAGRARGDLYDVLRQPIDSAREKFREQFFSQCSSMVDYLHLELMRTLAHDDPDLFGKDYPGPLV
jgi:hypothetical protein